MFRRILLLIVSGTALSCAQQDGAPETNSPATQGRSGTSEEPRQDQADQPTAPQTSWTPEYEKMTSVLNLSEDEATQLKEAFQAREAAFSKWRSEKGDQLAELEAQMADAAKARNLAEVKRLTAQAGPIRNELRELLDTHQENIRHTLSPENRLAWNAHQLAEKLLELMQPLDLTVEQVSAVRSEAVRAVKSSAKEPNPQAAAYLKLKSAIEAHVLTAQQQQSFDAIKKQNPLRSLR